MESSGANSDGGIIVEHIVVFDEGTIVELRFSRIGEADMLMIGGFVVSRKKLFVGDKVKLSSMIGS